MPLYETMPLNQRSSRPLNRSSCLRAPGEERRTGARMLRWWKGPGVSAVPALCLLVAGISSPLPAQSPRLVAPLYPGAVPSGEPGVYLTQDSPEEVRAFYEGRLGGGKVYDGGILKTLGPGIRPEEGDVYWTVSTRDEALAITKEPLNEALQTTAAGVVLEEPLPPVARPPEMELGSVRAVGDYFERLAHLTRVGTLEPSDVEPLIQRYLPLARMHYRRVESPDGRVVPFYEDQSVRCIEGVMAGGIPGDIQAESTPQDLEAMTARLQELYAQGKLQEAMALQQKITEQAMAGQMAEAVAEDDEGVLPTTSSEEMLEGLEGCLRELEPEGYTTRIRISTHPSEWELDRWWERRVDQDAAAGAKG